MPEINTCPSAQALTLFVQGKLSEPRAVTVAAHLETCAGCRKAVDGLPPGSFEGKVRAANPGGTVLPPARPGASPSMIGKLVTPPAPPADVPPELANHPKFRIVRELGRGGMGVIYLAEHRVLEKPVALKVISPAVLDNPDVLARFHAEARAAAKLDHPNIARAHDADQAGDLHFLVMEFVEGVTLAQVLERKGPLTVGAACHLVSQAALGLQHAFEHGMAHRDIKPQNLMVTPKGLVKVLDFGLARVRGERKAAPRLTQLESFMGTPEYVAPEQATDARSADTRSDVYSLGCTLYALLTGRPPFVEDTVVKLILAHVEKESQPLHEVRPDVPAELSAVVGKMLAKDPAQRYQTPVEVARALAPFVKAGAKAGASGGVSLPPGVASAKMGTRVGGDTSRVKGLGQGEGKLPAKAPAAEEEKGSPFGDLGGRATAPASKKAKERKEAKSTPTAWWKRPTVLAGAVGASLALILVAVVIIKIKVAPSPEGVASPGDTGKSVEDTFVILEINQPGAEVSVDGQKITITIPGDDKPVKIKVEPGQHKLRISKDGFEVVTKEVELKAGNMPDPIKVRLERQVAVTGTPEKPKDPAPGKGGFVPLFNGKDLKGWVVDGGDKNAWQVKDGNLVAIGLADDPQALQNQGYLLTEREYSDFVLRFQFQQAAAIKHDYGGVALRAKPHETAGSANPLFTGVNNQPYHLTVNVGGWFATGSLWWAIGESHTLEPDNLADLKKVGEWNDMEVEMQGQHLVITFNGRKVQDVMLNKTRPKANPAPGLSRYSGRLGFLKRVGEVRFRKIEIKELSATKAEAPPAVNGPEKDAAEVDKLTRALLDHPWYYHDNLFPPGETFRFNADGTFHVFKWKYWVVGPRAVRVHYDRNRGDKENGILFTFNEKLAEFTAEFTDPNGKVHKITGTRQ